MAKSPYKFIIVASMCDSLSLIELCMNDGGLAPTTDSMLRIVADMMWTMIIMFAGLFKLAPTLTSPNIEKPEEAQFALNNACMTTCLFFLLFFVSRWFQHYSIHLVGEKRDRVGNKAEWMISDLSKKPIVDRVLHLTTHAWCLGNYYGCFTSPNDLDQLVTIMFPFAVVRMIVLLNELKLALARIIDLDVNERNQTLKVKKSTVEENVHLD